MIAQTNTLMNDNKMPDEKPQSNAEFKRQVAYKCSIGTLAGGVFVKKPGWESNYVMTDFGDFSRVNIIAVVVAKDENSITLDDGTGQIVGRIFDNTDRLSDISIGNLVLVIARPREFNSQMYLTLEIIKKIDDKGWINYRKKELLLIQKVRNVDILKKADKPEAEIVQNVSTINSKERIIQIIKQLDTGSGTGIDDVIMISKMSNAEDIIQDMLLKGEIFEIKAGRLKLM
jgi:RPA family protein